VSTSVVIRPRSGVALSEIVTIRCRRQGKHHARITSPRTGLDTVAELAAQLRVDSIRSSTSAGSGHPTSSMSAADLLAVLVARHLRYDWDNPAADANDHLIFSKGHASPLLYSVFNPARPAIATPIAVTISVSTVRRP
jgi:hypothetical protein